LVGKLSARALLSAADMLIAPGLYRLSLVLLGSLSCLPDQ
jgi:hypothetical protein